MKKTKISRSMSNEVHKKCVQKSAWFLLLQNQLTNINTINYLKISSGLNYYHKPAIFYCFFST